MDIYNSLKIDGLKQILAGEAIRNEEQKTTDTRMKIVIAKMKKIWTYPVVEEEILKAAEECLYGSGNFENAKISQVMIDMLFYAGLKIIPECYTGLVTYTANKFKYHGICEGYLKCRMAFRCNDSWDNIYEMIEEEAERSLLVRSMGGWDPS
jgi:hypothetical protein